jgi:predicted nucleotidyltransferase component of viral defense system
MTDNYYSQALLDNTGKLIKKLQEQKPAFLSSFYLSGGTALSLQLGHRVSEDLDFFTQDTFTAQTYLQELELFGSLEHVELDSITLNAFLDGVKIQLLHYPYPLLENPNNWNGIQLSCKIDIACTKLVTVSQRGSKKDFIDVYFLLKEYSLEELLHKLNEKYVKVQYNDVHILKSLTFFTEADAQPMPRMLIDTNWEDVKQDLMQKVRQLSLVL